jgi:redox-sensitive bicupin YhaK (pirin superfamily)
MEAGAKWIIPSASSEANRTLYFHLGTSITIEENEIHSENAIQLNADQELTIENGNSDSYFLILQGKPINEPVVQYGPFVMNSNAEIQQAMHDYQRTQFGGWPWLRRDQVHPREKGRFAKHQDGTEEIR